MIKLQLMRFRKHVVNLLNISVTMTSANIYLATE